MNPYQRAAAMSMMETHDPVGQVNILGAMVNRARHDKADLGTQVGTSIYQPSFEPSQERRLADIPKDAQFSKLADVAEQYWSKGRPVPHNATHYLAPESTMLALEAKEPNKYKSWRDWTGFDPNTKSYSGVLFRDSQHAFLSPGSASSLTPPPPGMNAVPKGTTPVEYDPFDADTAKLLSQISPQTAPTPAAPPVAPKPKYTSLGDYILSNDQALPNVKLGNA